MKLTCLCGNDITTMEGCIKVATRYKCRKCRGNITKKKMLQLMKLIAKSWSE